MECDICGFDRDCIRLQDLSRKFVIDFDEYKKGGKLEAHISVGPSWAILMPMRICKHCLDKTLDYIGSVLMRHALGHMQAKDECPKCEICDRKMNGFAGGEIVGYINDIELKNALGRTYDLSYKLIVPWDPVCAACAVQIMLKVGDNVRDEKDFYTKRW